MRRDKARRGEAVVLVRHATFCGRQRRVVLSSPESVGPNGKITLVKCFAGLAPPCSTYVRVQREDSQAALIFNAAAPDSTHLFHTLHAAHSVLCGCGYVSWPDYNLPHETNANMYLHNTSPHSLFLLFELESSPKFWIVSKQLPELRPIEIELKLKLFGIFCSCLVSTW